MTQKALETHVRSTWGAYLLSQSQGLARRGLRHMAANLRRHARAVLPRYEPDETEAALLAIERDLT